jgi:hypothetical protein
MPGQERSGKQSSADDNKNKRKIRITQVLVINELNTQNLVL